MEIDPRSGDVIPSVGSFFTMNNLNVGSRRNFFHKK